MAATASLSVSPSHANIVLKQLNAESCKHCRTIANKLQFLEAKAVGKIQTGVHKMQVV